MKAIILAAGLGTRLGGLTQYTPKCLVKVNQIPILKQQVNCLKSVGINDISVVIGQNGSCWDKRHYDIISELCPNITINTKNMSTQNSYSLLIGLQSLIDCNEIIVIDGDVLFEARIILDIIDMVGDVSLLARRATSIRDTGTVIEIQGDSKAVKMGREVKAKNFPWLIYGGMLSLKGKKSIGSFISHMTDRSIMDKDLGYVLNKMLLDVSIFCVVREDGWININSPNDICQAEKNLFIKP